MSNVVTAFLRHRGDVLLVRRGDEVGTYRGKWGGVSGYLEGDVADAEADARREIAEETGILDVALVRAGEPLDLRDGDREWTVHPFLFEVGDSAVDGDDGARETPQPEVTLNYELVASEWVQPPEILAREAVPALWEAYERVAPTVEDVRNDETHGSAYISIRALEVLRDAAAVADGWEAVADAARALRDARPTMTALATRIDRVMAEAERTPEAVLGRAEQAVSDAIVADETAAAKAVELLASDGESGTEAKVAIGDGPIVTLSRSGTATAALSSIDRPIVVSESRPANEGVGVAERLAADGRDVTLVTDAALGYLLTPESERPENDGMGAAATTPAVALVGADTVLADGSVVNKTGTRLLALAAARVDVPLYVVTARDKIAPEETFRTEFGDDADLYEDGCRDGDQDRGFDVLNPIFDRTPADLVAGVITEDGALDTDEIGDVAAEHADFAAWKE